MHTFTAHNSRIRSLAVDSVNGTLITGSIDGELKVNIKKIANEGEWLLLNTFID